MVYAMLGDEMRAAQGKEAKGAKAKAEKQAGALIGEVVMTIRTVASFNAEHKFCADYAAMIDRKAHLDTISGVKNGVAVGCGMSVMMFVMSGMQGYMGYLISVGACTLQEGFVPMMMMMGAMITIMPAVMGVKDLPTANRAAKLFFEATGKVPHI